jgi:O-glycosyl hydrolase
MFLGRKQRTLQFTRGTAPGPAAGRFRRLALERLEDRSLLSLVAAYDFNEAGGTALDDSGQGNHGAVAGATYVSEGRYGGALSFDGAGDWVTVADAESLDLTTAMTLEAWVRPTQISPDWTTVLIKERTGGLAYALYAADGADQPPAGYIHQGVDISAAGSGLLPLNAWSHLAVTYDGAALRLYLNGTHVASRSQSGSIAVSGGPLRIGGNSVWGEYFTGLIDEVRVYDRALTRAEIQADKDRPIGSAPDIVAPTISLSSPAEEATVSGTVSVTAAASDNVAVVGVQFLLDGENLGPEDVEAPYATSWNTAAAAPGSHTLLAVARDAAGNSAASESVVVTVGNSSDVTPPTVSINSPADGSTVSGAITLTATASDDVGVAGVQFLLDGSPLGTEDVSAPYAASWNTHTTINGTHMLTAVARDAAGNATTSSGVTVTVSNIGGVPVTIDGAQRFQTIDGFGVNLNVNSWNGGQLAPALDLFIGDLGSSLFRVYIDNTDWETTNDDDDPLSFNWDFYSALYATPRFEDAWATIGHLNSRGITDGLILNFMGPGPAWMGGSRLAAAQEDEWVEMVLSYVVYARQNRGLEFHKLAPFNEADWNGQEGILVDAAQMARVLAKMAERLDALGLGDIRFVAPEGASAVASVETYMPELLANPAVMVKIDQFGFHNYAGDSAGASRRIADSSYSDREFWVTEQSFGHGQAFDGVDNLLRHLADGASAALVFKAVDGQDNHHPPGEDYGLGLMSYDSASGVYTAKSELTRMRHFHQFIRPGAVRIAASEDQAQLTALAFSDSATGRVTIIGRNTGSESLTIAGQLVNLPVATNLEFFHSTLSQPYAPQATVSVSGGRFTVTVAGNSLFTLASPANPDSPDVEPPEVTVTAPPPGASLVGNVLVEASATDNDGVAGVQFLLDGVPLSAEDRSAPFAVAWDTTTVANGSYSLVARARDAAGNQTDSGPVTIAVQNDTALGLVAAYGFDEGSGASAGDTSGNSLTGSIANASWTSAGKFGNALEFNGLSSWVTIDAASALDLTTELTLEAWVRPTALSGWRTVILKEAATEEVYGLYASQDGPSPLGAVRIGGFYSTATSGATVPLDSWSHLASTYDGQFLRLYVNGTEVASVPAAGTVEVSSGALRIGGNAIWGEFFAGLIDEVRIYNRALTAAEVQADMNAPIGAESSSAAMAARTARLLATTRDRAVLAAWLIWEIGADVVTPCDTGSQVQGGDGLDELPSGGLATSGNSEWEAEKGSFWPDPEEDLAGPANPDESDPLSDDVAEVLLVEQLFADWI